ncbi:MAG TPA: glycosyl transferase family 51, partial [Candidatus Eisenbacteria bacterium]|nr:glycosyl transferase family 51 [Candidatus Eisenbacteria bacterium]
WLLRTNLKHAQDLRLRARIERDAFARMTEDWHHVGFPFPHLVPSYATALGSSADQPGALADLMALLLNDGSRRGTSRIRRITFAPGTAYETTYAAPPVAEDVQVLQPAVARAARSVLADVVEHGTGRRMRGAFDTVDMSVEIGGKTGTGDNRVERYARGGRVISSEVINRTATFVFYFQDRYYGVISASVLGPNAASYQFTSALPVAVLRQLAPSIERRLGIATRAAPADSAASDTSRVVASAP